MSSSPSDGADAGLSADEAARLDAFRAAEDLSDLVALTDADSEHEAYFGAKAEWRNLREHELAGVGPSEFPGACVEVDDHEFYVHGITHADTEAEGTFLREHLAPALDEGSTVYCEQGIRPMYFADVDGVCEMDDYRWATAACRRLDDEATDARTDSSSAFAGLAEEVDSLVAQFRRTAFSLIHDHADLYGDRFRSTLGDLASDFLASHENMATGEDFESFTKARRAALDPDHLADLQRYYEAAFLPQPIEREWLRRHDPELEIVTHARNERMADYAVYHNETAETVHLVVGAAHQPGVRYYLERHRDGERSVDAFELTE